MGKAMDNTWEMLWRTGAVRAKRYPTHKVKRKLRVGYKASMPAVIHLGMENILSTAHCKLIISGKFNKCHWYTGRPMLKT